MNATLTVPSSLTWSIQECARHLSVSPGFIRRKIENQELRAYKLGDRVVVKSADAVRYLEDHPR
jgi:excisionase family DNA binding protein